jgi:hypothetical protein
MTRAELETTARIKRDTLRGLLDAMTDHPPPSPPKRKRSFSQIAALLPPVERPRFPRATTSPLSRGSSSDMTPAEHKAAQTIADARAKLDRADESPFPVLSHQIVANLSGEEISMLPMEIRLRLPEVRSWQTPPAIELLPAGDRISSRSVSAREAPVVAVEVPVRRPSLLALIALFVAAFFVGMLGAYVLS